MQLHLNSMDRAKECFIEALSIDVKCYESFDALVSGNMMDVQEGEQEIAMGLLVYPTECGIGRMGVHPGTSVRTADSR